MKNILTFVIAITALSANLFAQAEWQWAKGAGGTAAEGASGVGVDAAGNSYVVGRFSSASVVFGSTTLTNAGNVDMLIVKYDSNGTPLWAKRAGGTGDDRANKIVVDARGNSYVTGYFNSASITFGSTVLTSAGTYDIFVVKYDSGGNVVWAKSAGGTSDDLPYSIAIDDAGNSFIAGNFLSTVLTFGSSTLFSSTNFDMFILKYDSAGTPVWAVSAGSSMGTAIDKGFGITLDSSANVYVTGTFTGGSIVFGSTTLTNPNVGNANIFIAKYDSAGTNLWAIKPLGYNTAATDICSDAAGNFYLTGYFGASSMTFGSTVLSNSGGMDMFLAKYDVSGNAVWAKSYGWPVSGGGVTGGDIELDPAGNCYVVGNFSHSTIVFGSDTLTNYDATGSTADIYAVKYNSAGNELWAKSARGNGEDAGLGVAVDTKGNCYIAGHFYSSAIVAGPFTMANAGTTVTDLFAAKLYAPQHYVIGTLYADSNNDCVMQSPELKLPNILISTTPGNLYAMSNDSGAFALGILDSVNYTIQPVIPARSTFLIQNPCPVNYTILLDANDPIDTSAFDFGFDYSPCFLLRTDVAGDRKRRCRTNRTSVFYINEGLIPANGVTVHVKFDEFDFPTGADMPYTVDPIDSSLVFTIGTLNPNQSGTISIWDSVPCIFGIAGLTQCTKSWILPVNQCLMDSTTGATWDHSSVSVVATCVNDTVHFVIHNEGSGDMITASQYRIYADNVLSFTGSFQLLNGDSLVLPWVSGGATIRLEADQNPGHPGHSHPRVSIEACGTDGSGGVSLGQLNLASQDDEDVAVEIDCMVIVDSHDPNEKVVSPEGITASHFVLPGSPLDYIIHFQNTGTDTAYKVVVDDLISNDLDLATLEPGLSSHPYTLSIVGSGQPMLRFTFDNINLVDSTTNETLSNGFVKFKMSPKTTVPLGTVINNKADIYFDFNPSITTNTAFVTLGSDLTTSVLQNQINVIEDIRIYPNPFTSKTTISFSEVQKNSTIKIVDVLGNVVKYESVFGKNVVVDLSLVAKGVYFVQIIGENNRVENRKIVLQ